MALSLTTRYLFRQALTMAIDTLIVDDSSVMRKLILKNLRQGGITVDSIVEASNGEEALDKLKNNSVDLILTDWNMPEMDGLDLTMKIRGSENHSETPIIMISSEGEEGRVQKAIQHGADNYIIKPITPEEISKKVRNAVDEME